VVVDFPDPTNYSLGKLYTTAFYRRLSQNLSQRALIAVQSTSPLFARFYVERGKPEIATWICSGRMQEFE
jgi:predicted membrane-bound spermidine synthase